ncbi:MAG: hypothetical protein ACK56I_36370, partial [bacterium]
EASGIPCIPDAFLNTNSYFRRWPVPYLEAPVGRKTWPCYAHFFSPELLPIVPFFSFSGCVCKASVRVKMPSGPSLWN